MSNLQELLERVEKAEGGDRAIDTALELLLLSATTKEFPGADPRSGLVLILDAKERWVTCDADECTASIDATVALVEKMLPGCWVDLCGPRKYLHIPTPSPNHWRGMINAWNAQRDVVGWGATPALALIAALLSAMIAQEKE